MIRIIMLGRLGNNLFQYAFGRVMAEKHGVPLVMDGSWFNAEGWNQVNCLKRLPGPATGKARVVRRCSLGARALLKTTGKHYWEYRGVPVLREKEGDHAFNPQFLAAPADCLLFGYFQTPLYFQGFETSLRTELSTHDLGLEAGNEELAADLRKSGSIAMHVRRTDYAGNPDLDLCGDSYYLAAMKRMRETLANPRFFIFSDDPAWCASRYTDPNVTIVGNRQADSPLAGLHLMSLAGHHIIANSSYSWWAAWLGKKPDQKVFIPPQWFGGIVAPIGEKQAAGWSILKAAGRPAE